MNLKSLTLIAPLFVIFLSGKAQPLEIEWEKKMGTSGADMFIDILEDNTGGFTVLGASKSKTDRTRDFWLVHFEMNGDTLWTKIMGSESQDYPFSLAQLTDNGYVLVGKSEQDGSSRALVIKTDENGNEIWQKKIGDDAYTCADNVIALDDGCFVVSGSKLSGENNEMIWLIKFDSAGNTVWERLVEEGSMFSVRSLKKLPDGGFVLAGKVAEQNISDSELMVVRFTGEGEIIWEYKSDLKGKNVWPECICCSPDSNFVVIGWHGTCMNDINSENPVFDYDLYISKISQKGKLIWSRKIDSEGSEGGNAVAVRTDGKILMAGKKETSFLGNIGPWIVLSDDKGEKISELVMPFVFSDDQAAEIINSSDGGFVVIGPGKIDYANTRSDGWIKKFKAF